SGNKTDVDSVHNDSTLSFCFFTDSTSLDANLASVRDSQEYGAFQNLIGQNKAAWIGGTDAQQGKWRWTDGTPLTYTNWGNEDCLHLNAEGKSPNCRWFWNDLDCETPLPSVCAKNL
uniref:Ladderlectin-like n=1 Tax=Mastacembelus armatus TaxID=205130 RepID=A0A3Q3LT98_9TELE